jgi:hypothetical protein
MPLTAVTVVVPLKETLPGFAPNAKVTAVVALVTVFPLASSILTVIAGEIAAPAVAFDGSTAKASLVAVPEIPLPLRLTVCGLPAMLSLKDRVPVRVPMAVGEKTTDTVQLFPTATLEPQVETNRLAKSPVAPTLVSVMGTVPVLVKVTDCAVLEVLIAWLENDKDGTDSVALGAAAVICTVLGALELVPLFTISWTT